ncbi:hypothetical protein [Polymorphospora sp. NPDC050346]|uniref:hypothetical protein n=1 Tax=Polymorphospora sp. NPDC050346 TaxID=3155780 RepID=UPI0033D35BD6
MEHYLDHERYLVGSCAYLGSSRDGLCRQTVSDRLGLPDSDIFWQRPHEWCHESSRRHTATLAVRANELLDNLAPLAAELFRMRDDGYMARLSMVGAVGRRAVGRLDPATLGRIATLGLPLAIRTGTAHPAPVVGDPPPVITRWQDTSVALLVTGAALTLHTQLAAVLHQATIRAHVLNGLSASGYRVQVGIAATVGPDTGLQLEPAVTAAIADLGTALSLTLRSPIPSTEDLLADVLPHLGGRSRISPVAP